MDYLVTLPDGVTSEVGDLTDDELDALLAAVRQESVRRSMVRASDSKRILPPIVFEDPITEDGE